MIVGELLGRLAEYPLNAEVILETGMDCGPLVNCFLFKFEGQPFVKLSEFEQNES